MFISLNTLFFIHQAPHEKIWENATNDKEYSTAMKKS